MGDNDLAKRTCPLCAQISKSLLGARSHLCLCRKKTPELRNLYKTCPNCKKVETCHKAMVAHRTLCLRTCRYCDQVFSTRKVTTRHELRRHHVSRFLGQCQKCKMTFLEKSKLETHVKLCIVKNALYWFQSEEEMDKWIEQMQLETLSSFSHKSGVYKKRTQHGPSFSYKYCQHANIKQARDRRTSRRNKIGTIPNYNCKARIAIKHKGSRFFVKYFGKHSHPCEERNLVYQPFPASYRQELIEKLARGVKPKILYREELEKQLERKKINPKTDKRDTLTLRYLQRLKSEIFLNKARFSRIPKHRFKEMSSACEDRPKVRPSSSCEDLQEAYFEDDDISFVDTAIIPAQADPQYLICPFGNDRNQDEQEDKLEIIARIQEKYLLLKKYLEPSYLASVPRSIVKEVDNQMQKMLSILKAHANLPVKVVKTVEPASGVNHDDEESSKATNSKPICQNEEPKQIIIVDEPPHCTPATLTTKRNLLLDEKQKGGGLNCRESLKVANPKPAVQTQSQNGVTKRIIIVGKPTQCTPKTLTTGSNLLMNQKQIPCSVPNSESLKVMNSTPVCKNEMTKRIIIVRQPPQFTPTTLTPGRHLLSDQKQNCLAQVTVTK